MFGSCHGVQRLFNFLTVFQSISVCVSRVFKGQNSVIHDPRELKGMFKVCSRNFWVFQWYFHGSV